MYYNPRCRVNRLPTDDKWADPLIICMVFSRRHKKASNFYTTGGWEFVLAAIEEWRCLPHRSGATLFLDATADLDWGSA